MIAIVRNGYLPERTMVTGVGEVEIPSPGRDAIAALPYDAAMGTCEWFSSNEPEEAIVREAAYYIWLRNGCPENCDVEHWAEAYRGLCRSMGRVV